MDFKRAAEILIKHLIFGERLGQDRFSGTDAYRLDTDELPEYNRLYYAAKQQDTALFGKLLTSISGCGKRIRLVLLPPPLHQTSKLFNSEGNIEGYWTSHKSFKTVLQRAAASSTKHVEVIFDNIDITSPNGFRLLKDIIEKRGLLCILKDFQSLSLLRSRLSYDQWVKLVFCHPQADFRHLTESRQIGDILEFLQSREKLQLLLRNLSDIRGHTMLNAILCSNSCTDPIKEEIIQLVYDPYSQELKGIRSEEWWVDRTPVNNEQNSIEKLLNNMQLHVDERKLLIQYINSFIRELDQTCSRIRHQIRDDHSLQGILDILQSHKNKLEMELATSMDQSKKAQFDRLL